MDNCCEVCQRPFAPELLCCCDHATNDDGTHEDGVCVECCTSHPRVRVAGVGGYERADCDS